MFECNTRSVLNSTSPSAETGFGFVSCKCARWYNTHLPIFLATEDRSQCFLGQCVALLLFLIAPAVSGCLPEYDHLDKSYARGLRYYFGPDDHFDAVNLAGPGKFQRASVSRIVIASKHLLRHSNYIVKFDEHKGSGWQKEYFTEERYRQYLLVSPGKHDADIRYTFRRWHWDQGNWGWDKKTPYEADLKISFVTEVGRDYRIFAERHDKRDFVWVEDVAPDENGLPSGKLIAGKKP